ncbi:NADase-type glycan-binding domain-containing protein [Micromonospora echinospora]|uniref:NADase-type glycan-binding domain-containing protein n=1 Tax=Micromonospora echinospora TaxID=1877 RepID=UPI0037A14E23
MIVCRECGNHNGDADTFCGSCGSFLEWTGEKTTPKIDVEAVEEAEQEIRHRPTLLQRIAGVIAPPPGGTAVDTGVIRVSDGSARGPGARPGLSPGPGGPRLGPPGTGGPAGLSGPRPGPPGTGRPLPPGVAGPPGTARPLPPGVAGPPGTGRPSPPGVGRPSGDGPQSPPGVGRPSPPGTTRLSPPGVGPGPLPRTGPPGTGGPPGTRPGPRPAPPGTEAGPPRTAPPGTRPGPPGSPTVPGVRSGAPGTRPGVPGAAPVRRLPPPPPGVTNARLPTVAERPPGPRSPLGTVPPARSTTSPSVDSGSPSEDDAPEGGTDVPEKGHGGVAVVDPAEDAEPVASPPSRHREALAAPHTRALVATDDAASDPTDRTTSGRTSGRSRTGEQRVDFEPEEVTPQAVRPRTVTTGRRASTRRLQPGDLVCGECGEGNPPTRRFCSRCGDSLRTAEVVRRRWWQRLLPRRGPRVTEAGVRPGTPGGGAPGGAGGVLQSIYQRANAVAAVVLFALGIAYLIYPPLRERVNAVVVPPVQDARAWVDRKLNPRFVAVRPVEVTGSESVRDQGPDLTVDQYRNTHWQVRWDAERPPTVTLRFGEKVDLERLIVIAGTAEDYTASHRPAKLHLVWSTNRSDTLTVQDTGEPQTLTLTAAEGVTSVQIQVTDVYRAEKGTDVAVSELEFFARE